MQSLSRGNRIRTNDHLVITGLKYSSLIQKLIINTIGDLNLILKVIILSSVTRAQKMVTTVDL